jgi:hypothetical protein
MIDRTVTFRVLGLVKDVLISYTRCACKRLVWESAMAQPEANLKVQVIKTDMESQLQRDVIAEVDAAIKAATMERMFHAYKQMATSIKRSLDEKHGPYWQCIVGSRFGTKVEHRSGSFLYMKVGDYAEFVVYKSKAIEAP